MPLGLSIDIEFSVDFPTNFSTWVGRFVGRVVSEVLGGLGLSVPHNAREKPFTVSPVLDGGGRVVGRLVPGVPYFFRVSFMCSFVDCSRVVDGFAKSEIRLSTGEVLRVVRVNVRELHVGGSQVGRSLITWSVRFWPTSFIFRSYYVTWPSPARFFSSVALTLSRVLRGNEALIDRGGEALIGAFNDVDSKDFVKDLVFNTEVIETRIKRLMINLGRGRRMPAFEGMVKYITYTERPNLFRLLLDIANAYGVGKNRALGLGYVSAEVVEERWLTR